MRVMGIDYGTKRVGYAMSDPSGGTAFPGGVIAGREEGKMIREIGRIVAEEGVEVIVVGMPLSMSGARGIAAEKVEGFVERLREEVETPVETFDERLSTVRAERAMLGADLSRAKRGKRRDAVAAAMFLQTWLDRHPARGNDEG